MSFITSLIALFNVNKTTSSVILAVASGLGMILTKALGWGISEIFQILAVVFSGASVIGLRIAVAELTALAQAIQGPAAATGNGQATGTGNGPAAKTN
jgi:hypothetical protein